MKYTIVTVLLMASTVTTVAVAQDGTGHGPPKSPIIVMPQPIPVPTTASPAGSVSKLFQPKSRLASMTK
jgi:hypothetical protein